MPFAEHQLEAQLSLKLISEDMQPACIRILDANDSPIGKINTDVHEIVLDDAIEDPGITEVIPLLRARGQSTNVARVAIPLRRENLGPTGRTLEDLDPTSSDYDTYQLARAMNELTEPAVLPRNYAERAAHIPVTQRLQSLGYAVRAVVANGALAQLQAFSTRAEVGRIVYELDRAS